MLILNQHYFLHFLVMNLKDRECVVCHKTYTPRSGNQKTCSKACREKYIKKMQPIWNKKSYQKHKKKRQECSKAYRKDYYQKNKDKINKQNKEWNTKNKDKVRIYSKKWRTEHKTYLKDYRQQRREKEIDDAFNKYHQYLQTIEQVIIND